MVKNSITRNGKTAGHDFARVFDMTKTPYHMTDKMTPDRMSKGVMNRDRNLDGLFYYGVVTTGVFCRPSCPSKQAKTAHMKFYPTQQAAEQAGFRPCKICIKAKGDQDVGQKMVNLAVFIADNRDQSLSLATLARRVALSEAHVQKSFKALFGVSPKKFQNYLRHIQIKHDLKAGEDILSAVFGAGYGSVSRFYSQVDSGLGMTPAVYRRGGAGETIHFRTDQTRMGYIIMAATEKGLCFVMVGDDKKALIQGLYDEFPKAEIIENTQHHDQLKHWMMALDAYLTSGHVLPDMPLDLRGTAFQIKVWDFLKTIPNGQVRTYQQVAAGIGADKSVRAAASAIAKNKLAVLIPCHRVIRTDGGMGGFRWGVDRKEKLLAMEAQSAKGKPS